MPWRANRTRPGDDEADDAGDVSDPETAAVHINDLHASDDPIAIANAASWPTPMTLRQQLLAACEAAEHWLQAELDRPGETRPDDILRTLRAAIERAQAAAAPGGHGRAAE